MLKQRYINHIIFIIFTLENKKIKNKHTEERIFRYKSHLNFITDEK